MNIETKPSAQMLLGKARREPVVEAGGSGGPDCVEGIRVVHGLWPKQSIDRSDLTSDLGFEELTRQI